MNRFSFVCASLPDVDWGVVKRNLMDVTGMALPATTICILLCGCKNDHVVQELQAHYIALDADLLVCAGLQAGKVGERIRRCIYDFRSHLARSADAKDSRTYQA